MTRSNKAGAEAEGSHKRQQPSRAAGSKQAKRSRKETDSAEHDSDDVMEVTPSGTEGKTIELPANLTVQVHGDTWIGVPPSAICNVPEPDKMHLNGKIGVFNLDTTIVSMRPGSNGAVQIDWLHDDAIQRLQAAHEDGYTLVFYCTQPVLEQMIQGDSVGATACVEELLQKVGVPAAACCAARKEGGVPHVIAWNSIVRGLAMAATSAGLATPRVDKKSCFFVGADPAVDAAASKIDKAFAKAAGLPFRSASEFFGGLPNGHKAAEAKEGAAKESSGKGKEEAHTVELHKGMHVQVNSDAWIGVPPSAICTVPNVEEISMNGKIGVFNLDTSTVKISRDKDGAIQIEWVYDSAMDKLKAMSEEGITPMFYCTQPVLEQMIKGDSVDATQCVEELLSMVDVPAAACCAATKEQGAPNVAAWNGITRGLAMAAHKAGMTTTPAQKKSCFIVGADRDVDAAASKADKAFAKAAGVRFIAASDFFGEGEKEDGASKQEAGSEESKAGLKGTMQRPDRKKLGDPNEVQLPGKLSVKVHGDTWVGVPPSAICNVPEIEEMNLNGKIGVFNLDSTVSMRPGNKGKIEYEWVSDSVVDKLQEAHEEGYTLVFYCTQPVLEQLIKGDSVDATACVEQLLSQLPVPAAACCAAKKEHSVPSIVAWNSIVRGLAMAASEAGLGTPRVDKKSCFVVGADPDSNADASKVDQEFAETAGVQFHSASDFFGSPGVSGGKGAEGSKQTSQGTGSKGETVKLPKGGSVQVNSGGWTGVPSTAICKVVDRDNMAMNGKIAAFNLDTSTVTMHPYGKGKIRYDWVNETAVDRMQAAHEQGFTVVLYCSQPAMEQELGGADSRGVTACIDELVEQVGVPVVACCATRKDDCSIPHEGAWHAMLRGLGMDASKVDTKHSFFVGANPASDAAAGKADKEFATKVGVHFLTPEDFFGIPGINSEEGSDIPDWLHEPSIPDGCPNKELALCFKQLAELAYVMRKSVKNHWRIRSFQNAAAAIVALPETLKSIEEANEKVPLGKWIHQQMEEWFATGKIQDLENLRIEQELDAEEAEGKS